MDFQVLGENSKPLIYLVQYPFPTTECLICQTSDFNPPSFCGQYLLPGVLCAKSLVGETQQPM